MTGIARVCSFSLAGALMLVFACGDTGSEPNGTAVSVFMPSLPNVTGDWDLLEHAQSLEYMLACDPDPDGSFGNAVPVEGTFERTEAFQIGLDGPTGVWKGVIDFEPGPCVIQLRARDADEEVICSYSEPVTFDPTRDSEAYFNMVCFATCPTVPLPRSEASRKNFCAPIGGLIVSAETPADVPGVEAVRYAVTGGQDFLDNDAPILPVYEGALQRTREGTANFGNGAVETNVWEGVASEILANALHTVEVTAIDAEGERLCSAEMSIEVFSGAIAHTHLILPCSD
jgi:hypothetical protein